MNRESFFDVFNNRLTPDQKEIIPLFLEGLSNKEIEETLRITSSAISKRIKSIAERFSCPDTQNSRDYLVELFAKYKRELVSEKLLEAYSFEIIKPHFPDRSEPLNSIFYIEHDGVESNLDTLLTESIVRIKAPRKMGKTSLLKRIIAHCQLREFHTAYLDLSQIEDSKLSHEEGFIRLFYNSIIQDLLEFSPRNEWDLDLSTMTNCTTNLQSLLKKLNHKFVVVIDEVDHLFEYPHIYQNFFPLLRNWYEKTNDSKTWEKLRLVIAYSTEDYGRLNINQSPFNVGFALELKEFTSLQVQNLASRHGLNREDMIPLIEFVGGHPFLIRLAFYHLFYETVTLAELLKNAATDSGIYKEHLLRLFNGIKDNETLKQVFLEILDQKKAVSLTNKTLSIYQLESMGLIKLEGNLARVSCELYRQYFRSRLA